MAIPGRGATARVAVSEFSESVDLARKFDAVDNGGRALLVLSSCQLDLTQVLEEVQRLAKDIPRAEAELQEAQIEESKHSASFCKVRSHATLAEYHPSVRAHPQITAYLA